MAAVRPDGRCAAPEAADGGGRQHARVFDPLRARVVDREWIDLARALVDAGQALALLWQLSQPWPWPARWLRATRWVNALNLDAFSFRTTGAAMGSTAQSFSLWGEMRHYWAYALGWALAPVVAVVGLQLAVFRWRRAGEMRVVARQIRWENALLQVFQMLYMPIGLAVFRLVNCDENGIVSVDPNGMRECFGLKHSVAIIFITIVLGGGFLLGLPWILAQRITCSLVHNDPQEHEHFIRGKELEYVLVTSESYMELYMPQYASYRREAVMAPVESCVLKLLLLVDFSLLRSPAPKTGRQGLQGIIFFALLLLWTVRQSCRGLYRSAECSTIERIAVWMVTANGLLGIFSATGVRSALTVATAMTKMLVFTNVSFLVLLALYLSKKVYNARRKGSKQSSSSFWLAKREVKDQMLADPGLLPLVTAIKDTKLLLQEALLVPPSMRSYDQLDAALSQLQGCYSETVEMKLLLADQIRDLMYRVSELYTDAVASNPFRQDVFPKEDLSTLASIRLRQGKRRVLMTKSTQRILTKLEAARAWKRNPALRRGQILENEMEAAAV